MAYLAIDTSSALLSVAVSLSPREEVIGQEEMAGQKHAERLPQVCDEVLEGASLSYAQISTVVVGSGPGSFTGLRIGYSFAKGLAVSLRIPLVSVSSFHAFHSSKPEILTVLGDARSDLFFYSHGLEEPCLLTREELGQQLAHGSTQEVLSLDPLPKGLEYLAVQKPQQVAWSLLKLASAQVGNHQKPFNIEELSSLTPHYLRSVAAKTILERTVLTKV